MPESDTANVLDNGNSISHFSEVHIQSEENSRASEKEFFLLQVMWKVIKNWKTNDCKRHTNVF